LSAGHFQIAAEFPQYGQSGFDESGECPSWRVARLNPSARDPRYIDDCGSIQSPGLRKEFIAVVLIVHFQASMRLVIGSALNALGLEFALFCGNSKLARIAMMRSREQSINVKAEPKMSAVCPSQRASRIG